MKIKFLATLNAPEYDIQGETINGFDLSPLETAGKFVGNEQTKEAGIRDAYRDEQGELHVTLKQSVIASQYPERSAHWRGVDNEIDAEDYEQGKCYVTPTGVSDLEEGKDYEIVWAEGRGKNEEGFTISKLEG